MPKRAICHQKRPNRRNLVKTIHTDARIAALASIDALDATDRSHDTVYDLADRSTETVAGRRRSVETVSGRDERSGMRRHVIYKNSQNNTRRSHRQQPWLQTQRRYIFAPFDTNNRFHISHPTMFGSLAMYVFPTKYTLRPLAMYIYFRRYIHSDSSVDPSESFI